VYNWGFYANFAVRYNHFPMIKNFLNGLLIVFLMLSYINRGLYVDMSEANYACSKHCPEKQGEINSVLELILKLSGYGENDIDEDGDSPENYTTIQFTQLLIYQDFAQTLKLYNLYLKDNKKSFCIYSDLLYTQLIYGQIDHPPEA